MDVSESTKCGDGVKGPEGTKGPEGARAPEKYWNNTQAVLLEALRAQVQTG